METFRTNDGTAARVVITGRARLRDDEGREEGALKAHEKWVRRRKPKGRLANNEAIWAALIRE